MTSTEFMKIFYPVIYSLITIILGYLFKEIIQNVIPAAVKLINHLIELVVLKVGKSNYDRMVTAGWDIWHIIEEKYRLSQLIGDLAEAKRTEFESMIKQKLPGITDVQIEEIRQAIAGEFNKGKECFKIPD